MLIELCDQRLREQVGGERHGIGTAGYDGDRVVNLLFDRPRDDATERYRDPRRVGIDQSWQRRGPGNRRNSQIRARHDT